jgi:hypothetical protein
MDVLVPLASLSTWCGRGCGVAVCPALGVLVTSNVDDNTLNVFSLPTDVGGRGQGVVKVDPGRPAPISTVPSADACTGAGSSAGLVPLFSLGGASSRAPMQFKFMDFGFLESGFMAFTGPATSRRLLVVTDAGNDAVHIIDVAGREHVGYVAARGTIAGPRGVAARGSLVAISAWKWAGKGDHVVRLFEGSGVSWSAIRVLAGGFGDPGSADGQLWMPHGLRFSVDGSELVVGDLGNARVSLLRASDGTLVRHITAGRGAPRDVEEHGGGWLVACWNTHTVDFVGGPLPPASDGALPAGDVRRARGALGCRQTVLDNIGTCDGELAFPCTLALVPGLGLAVRGMGERGWVQLFATPEYVAMASMSPTRVAWIVAVARGTALRGTALRGKRTSALASSTTTHPKRHRRCVLCAGLAAHMQVATHEAG